MGGLMAVVLAVAAVAMLVVSVALGPDQPSPWLRAVYLIAQWTGPLLLAALVCVVAGRKAVRWGERILVKLTGPALIKAMSPREVLGALLPLVYGNAVGHQEVLTAVLGGAGRDPAGRDTAVSRETTAHYRLWAVNESTCGHEATWTHDFSGVRDNHRLVLFATSDPSIAGLVSSERRYPLFELWLLDEEQLEEWVRTLRATLEVGITYKDIDGVLHVVPPRPLRGEEVPLMRYDEFIRLPDGIDRKDLQMVEFDLHDLADPDHVVDSIESLSMRTVHYAADPGYLYWTPPHPCYVRSVTFDVEELAFGDRKLAYMVVGSTIKKMRLPLQKTWTIVSDRIEVGVDAWMLPGHTITLLWRPID
jgi:hypothetical protein